MQHIQSYVLNLKFRIMTEYKDVIKQHLQGALEWVLKNRDLTAMDRRMVKLEAR